MKLTTLIKFGIMIVILALLPLLIACGFFYIYEAHTSTYLGFMVGCVIDMFLFFVLVHIMLPSTVQYAQKKQKEKELINQ